jgi:hypothetical protein
MTDEDPKRLAAGEDGLLKGLIEEGRKELATPAQLSAVAAKLGPVLGGGGGPGAGGSGGGGAGAARPPNAPAPKFAGMSLTTSLGVAAIGAGTLLTILRVATNQEPLAVPLSQTPEGPLPGLPVVTGPVSPPDPTAPLTVPAVDPSAMLQIHHSEAAAPPASARNGPNPGNELRLLTQAQDVISADPAKALEICKEHAKRFPASKFAEDREVLAVAALVSLGRTDEARERADAFRVAFPGSASQRRIDQILSSP